MASGCRAEVFGRGIAHEAAQAGAASSLGVVGACAPSASAAFRPTAARRAGAGSSGKGVHRGSSAFQNGRFDMPSYLNDWVTRGGGCMALHLGQGQEAAAR